MNDVIGYYRATCPSCGESYNGNNPGAHTCPMSLQGATYNLILAYDEWKSSFVGTPSRRVDATLLEALGNFKRAKTATEKPKGKTLAEVFDDEAKKTLLSKRGTSKGRRAR